MGHSRIDSDQYCGVIEEICGLPGLIETLALITDFVAIERGKPAFNIYSKVFYLL
jgi:hypothetical protein